MDSRREFLKKVAMFSGAGAAAGMLPPSIQRAFSLNPQPGTTFLDAEHVVILMQENRSFDHCFGTLQGVRGFRDPRAILKPDNKPVWVQVDEKGESYVPFRLNIKETKSTWMGSLPHGWADQVDARNGGRYDKWLVVKKSGRREYSHMPLALGFHSREDIPFYYSLADAFTVCDQNFCSSLTGTTANRLYLWTGKIREDVASPPRVRNEETDFNAEAQWTTFPERLEDNSITWKIYQNELTVGAGLDAERDAWLGNFGDNPIEWFSQYHVKFHPPYLKYLPAKIERLKKDISEAEEKLKALQEGSDEYKGLRRRLESGRKALEVSVQDLKILTPENYARISQREKDIHKKAFTTNANDPAHHDLSTLAYREGGTSREMKVPKGDVLHQFREDVKSGNLPTVSWLVAPENFSDHPGAPWYGAWYLSEAMDILTRDPDVWKKTIFILCYDENDGYFDHVPPFVPPMAGKPETGLVSATIDTADEFVTMEHELRRKPPHLSREGCIGLGYRVPLVIASPWSRGGMVCSQVFDHTSIIMFLEKFLAHKTGKKIVEPNISSWRRTVCGDLTSAFRPYNGEQLKMPEFVKRDDFMTGIHKAQFKSEPSEPRPLAAEAINQFGRNLSDLSLMPLQEKGTRPSCAVPYELYAIGNLSDDRKSFELVLEARKDAFGDRAAGVPFQVYVPGNTWSTRSYAVAPGDRLRDSWPLETFEDGNYLLRVYGPNGFFREFKGNRDAGLQVGCEYERAPKKGLTGNIILLISNRSENAVTTEIRDNGYKQPSQSKRIPSGGVARVLLDLKGSSSWYDTSVLIAGSTLFETRVAGRVETGKESISDPLMA